MKMLLRFALLLTVCISASSLSASSTIVNLAKAQALLNKVNQIVEKYQMLTVQLEAPTPMPNNSGKYLLPYTASGALTEWANKALTAQAGAALGEKAGNAAGKALAAKVPFGGLMSGAAKKKGKEIGAVTAIGGKEFIASSSDQSFQSVDDYILYLHVNKSNSLDYEKALASAMAIYPELEQRFNWSIKNAYKKAAKKKKL